MFIANFVYSVHLKNHLSRKLLEALHIFWRAYDAGNFCTLCVME